MRDVEEVPVANATTNGLLLPAVGVVEIGDGVAIGIRHGQTVIALPASHAVDIALDIAEVAVERAASVDAVWVERLIARALALAARLGALNDEGRTHQGDAAERARALHQLGRDAEEPASGMLQ